MANLTAADRAALEWQLTDADAVDAWVAHVEATFGAGAAQIIANKITVCKARRAASPDKRPRAVRDAEAEEAMKPSALAAELSNTRHYAQVQADLVAAKALGLAQAEQFLTDELAQLAPK